MLLVNLYGAPGAGKSTGATYIFSQLKMAGINAEYVSEFAKDKVWERSQAVFENQAYIFGKQYFRISRIGDQVDVIVTDSPLLLCAYYNNDPVLGKAFDETVASVARSYNQLNFFVGRVKAYNPKGRFQTEAQSDQVAGELLEALEYWKVPIWHIDGDTEGYDKAIGVIKGRLANPLMNKPNNVDGGWLN